MDIKTFSILAILLGLIYVHYQCESSKRKKMLKNLQLNVEGFSVPFRCDSYGDFYDIHGIPNDPYTV